MEAAAPVVNGKKSAPSGRVKGKTIEERYQKKTLLEQILLRPDTYIGSVQPETQATWVWSEERQRMECRKVTYTPGLHRIFDEIIVNAADVKARQDTELRGEVVHKMTQIRVELDKDAGLISVLNDGDSIPIEIHKEQKIYVPEMIFGHLLTSDNYDDTEQRVTGGRNGYGAKLTNTFSKEFSVDCCDGKKKFRMKWQKNMSTHTDPRITDVSGGTAPYVKVTFRPDFPKFGMTMFDDDCIALLTKRVYDIAGTTGVKVWLNGRRIIVKDFKSYVDLYFDPEKTAELPRIHDKDPSQRWEVVVSQSDGQFQQVSFVNSICTSKGGTHVTHVTDPLIAAILKRVTAKNKGGMELKGHHVKSHIWVFVKCLVVNPLFDSQAKETLTLKQSQFGSKCELSEKTIAAVCKSSLVDQVLMWAQAKQQVELKKKMKASGVKVGRDRITGIPKLEDANDAGTKHSEGCTLIITEGDSAKTSCLAGLSVVGRDRYGIFPLRGKLLNVRDASYKQQIGNAEIQNIMSVMGLKVGDKGRCDIRGLRYGSVMMMTDQDFDGSHIKGLLINMIHHYWPGLIKRPGFLKEFATPIVKAFRQREEYSFFSMPEYEEWKRQNNDGKGWRIKYYKGLGTSTDREFKEYFSELERHQMEFGWEGPQDDECIDMAFHPKRVEDRKNWIQQYQVGTYLDHNQQRLTYDEFVNKELILYSRYDVERSIPSVVDGFKPGQRKVLFAMLKKNIKNELKVVQLAGYVAEHSCYHHGETSLQSTIVGMAQTFVGSNNVNILDPCGQFGSRKEGGKDASAARYIFTRLTHSARAIFHPADDPILEYQTEEGMIIEPKFYVPVIPLTLVNGAEGIGTGWSSYVPNFNPREIVYNIQRWLKGEAMEPMLPWYRGFKGRIERQEKGTGFDAVGTVKKIDEQTVEITELPVRFWTQTYKEMLEEALDLLNEGEAAPKVAEGKKKGKGEENEAKGAKKKRGGDMSILDYRDNSSHDDIHFTVRLSKSEMAKAEKDGLEKYFKLRKPIASSNMTLFNSDGKVYRYATELDIIRDFAQLRLTFYHKRKDYQLAVLQKECAILGNRFRFITEVTSDNLKINNRRKAEILEDLVRLGFDPMSKLEQTVKDFILRGEVDPDGAEEEDATEETDNTGGISAKDFDYLVGMPIWNLSVDKIEELKKTFDEKENERSILQKTTHEELWMVDLENILSALDKQDQIDEDRRAENAKFRRQRRITLSGMKGGKPKRGAVKKKPAVTASAKKQAKRDKFIVDNTDDSSCVSLSDPPSSDDDAENVVKRQPKQSPVKRRAPPLNSKTASPPLKQRKAAAGWGGGALPTPPESPKPLKSFTLFDRLKNKTAAPGGEAIKPQGKDSETLEEMFAKSAAALDAHTRRDDENKPTANGGASDGGIESNPFDDVPFFASVGRAAAKRTAKPTAAANVGNRARSRQQIVLSSSDCSDGGGSDDSQEEPHPPPQRRVRQGSKLIAPAADCQSPPSEASSQHFASSGPSEPSASSDVSFALSHSQQHTSPEDLAEVDKGKVVAGGGKGGRGKAAAGSGEKRKTAAAGDASRGGSSARGGGSKTASSGKKSTTLFSDEEEDNSEDGDDEEEYSSDEEDVSDEDDEGGSDEEE